MRQELLEKLEELDKLRKIWLLSQEELNLSIRLVELARYNYQTLLESDIELMNASFHGLKEKLK